MSLRALSLSVALFSLTAPALAETWKIDGAHSSANFRVRHMMASWVRGTIGGIEGEISLDDKDVTKSTVEAKLDATSINTSNKKRDEHLRSADFFDTGKFPQITFKSKSVKGSGPDLTVAGALTMRGVTKDVELKVEGPTAAVKGMQGEMRRGLTARTTLNRKDYGVAFHKLMDGGGLVVGDEVEIEIELELIAGGKAAH